MDPDKVKHMEFIQAIINRLAANSFAIKGWSITLVAALFALASKEANPLYALIAFLPAFFFWGLDAYFLRQERLFRGLYDLVRNDPSTSAFGMDTSIVPTTKWNVEKGKVPGWLRTIFSKTIVAFHLPLVLVVIAVLGYAYMKPGTTIDKPIAAPNSVSSAIKD